jgi:proteasome lid subunit RPN8/RPN11
MNSTIWEDARNQISTDRFVIGWYHSHPNLGAFFSGTDRKTQREFFNREYHLGLVIDPVRNEERWFYGSESGAVELSNILRPQARA